MNSGTAHVQYYYSTLSIFVLHLLESCTRQRDVYDFPQCNYVSLENPATISAGFLTCLPLKHPTIFYKRIYK